MKIGIVCYPTFGGSGVVATELGMALAHKNHEVHFITYNQPVRLDFISSGLHFHQVQIKEYPLFERWGVSHCVSPEKLKSLALEKISDKDPIFKQLENWMCL